MLLLDEPFGALDAFTREELWCILRDLWTEQQFNVILVTHDLREIGVPGRHGVRDEQEPGALRGASARSTCRARATWRSPTRREFTDIVHELRGHIGAHAQGRRDHQSVSREPRHEQETSRTLVALAAAGGHARAVADHLHRPSTSRSSSSPAPGASGRSSWSTADLIARPCLAHLLGHHGRLRHRHRGRRAAGLPDRQLAPGLRRRVPADDRLQRAAQGGLRADPGGVVRHRRRARPS